MEKNITVRSLWKIGQKNGFYQPENLLFASKNKLSFQTAFP